MILEGLATDGSGILGSKPGLHQKLFIIAGTVVKLGKGKVIQHTLLRQRECLC